MKNADIPAMPCEVINPHIANQLGQAPSISFSGMSKREMFAMHAPSNIPDWFKNQFKPDVSHLVKPELTDHQEEMMIEYENDNYGLSKEDFQIGSDASSLMRQWRADVKIEFEKQIYFAWKVAHADELLKELDK